MRGKKSAIGLVWYVLCSPMERQTGKKIQRKKIECIVHNTMNQKAWIWRKREKSIATYEQEWLSYSQQTDGLKKLRLEEKRPGIKSVHFLPC